MYDHVFYQDFVDKLYFPLDVSRTTPEARVQSPVSRRSKATTRPRATTVDYHRRPSSASSSSIPSKLFPSASRSPASATADRRPSTSSTPHHHSRTVTRRDVEETTQLSAGERQPSTWETPPCKSIDSRRHRVRWHGDAWEPTGGTYDGSDRRASQTMGRRNVDSEGRGKKEIGWGMSRVRSGSQHNRTLPGEAATRGRTSSGRDDRVASLREMILDALDDEHGGASEGARALRSALRRQDLTRR